MAVQILTGECRALMDALEPESVQCGVTSPPYFGLRDYGTEPVDWPEITYSPMPGVPACIHVPAMRANLGLEPTLEAFIGHLVLVFRSVRRVLRKDGICWVNMGDSYSGARRGGSVSDSSTLGGIQPEHARYAHQAFTEAHKGASLAGLTASRRRDDEPIPRSDLVVPGLAPKNMVGQPWRVAFALQADGWVLRRDVIWHKLNPMPESARDRPTTAHEYLFILAKSSNTLLWRAADTGEWVTKRPNLKETIEVAGRKVRRWEGFDYYYEADAIKELASPDTHARYQRGRSSTHKHADAALVPGERPQTLAQGFGHMRKPVAGWASGGGSHTAVDHAQLDEARQGKLLTGAYGDGKSDRLGRGPGWRNNGVGWGHGTDADERERERVASSARKLVADNGHSGVRSNHGFDAALVNQPEWRNKRSVWPLVTEPFKGAHFATFPSALVEPCILAGCPPGGVVIDFFGGSGTTGLVADRLGRDAILCELNPVNTTMAGDRLAADKGHVSRQRSMDVDPEGAPA